MPRLPARNELLRLSAVVDAHAEELRAANVRSSFARDGFVFRWLKQDKNTVYRVKGDRTWFLKLPVVPERMTLLREEAGGVVAVEVLAGSAHYLLPAAASVNRDIGYTLAAAIAGRPLHHMTHLYCLNPRSSAVRALRRTYSWLGQSLARLHSAPVNPELPSSDRSATRSWGWQDRTGIEESIVRGIEAIAQRRRRGEQSLVHGNARMDNVIVSERGLGFIDFENFGRGWAYDDLSIVLSQLDALTALAWFPERRVAEAKESFLEAYSGQRPVDYRTLKDVAAVRLGAFYCDTARKAFPRIAGIPIIKARLRALVERSVFISAFACVLRGKDSCRRAPVVRIVSALRWPRWRSRS